jgi:hypothetical protein
MPTSAPPAFPSLFPLPYFSIRFSEYLQKSQNSVFCLWGLRREERLGQNAACVVLTREKIKYEGGRGAVGSTDIHTSIDRAQRCLKNKVGAVERVHITQVYTNCSECPSGGLTEYPIHRFTYTIPPCKQ